MQFELENLQTTILNAPIGICVLDAGTLVCELVNDKFIEVAGKSKDEILDRFYWDAFAEARSAYEAALLTVVEKGETYTANEVELMLIRYGKEETVYVTFVYSPVKDKDGQVIKVTIWVLENTNQVTERQRVDIERVVFQKERDKLNNFFLQAPIGICVLDGPELTYELINPLYQKLFPGRALLGKPLLQAVPEITGAAIWDILQGVYKTGITYKGDALLIPLAKTTDGPVEDRYFNFIYQARKDVHGTIDGIVVCVFEVTDLIVTQTDLQTARDTLDLAITASEIGIRRADLVTDELVVSARTRIIHGIPVGKEMTLATAFEMIIPEHRDRVMQHIAQAVENRTIFSDETISIPWTAENHAG